MRAHAPLFSLEFGPFGAPCKPREEQGARGVRWQLQPAVPAAIAAHLVFTKTTFPCNGSYFNNSHSTSNDSGSRGINSRSGSDNGSSKSEMSIHAFSEVCAVGETVGYARTLVNEEGSRSIRGTSTTPKRCTLNVYDYLYD